MTIDREEDAFVIITLPLEWATQQVLTAGRLTVTDEFVPDCTGSGEGYILLVPYKDMLASITVGGFEESVDSERARYVFSQARMLWEHVQEGFLECMIAAMEIRGLPIGQFEGQDDRNAINISYRLKHGEDSVIGPEVFVEGYDYVQVAEDASPEAIATIMNEFLLKEQKATGAHAI